MNRLAWITIWLLVVAVWVQPARAAGPALLPWPMLEDGWVQLFDGESLFGWQPVGSAKWEVRDGAIATDGSSPGFLMTTTRWADYEFQCEFRAPAATNSGVFLRTPLEPKDPAHDCYELNIAPADNPFPTGSLVGRQRLHSPSPNPSPQVGGEQSTLTPSPSPNGRGGQGWHTFRVTAWAGWIRVELDGQPITDYNDASPVRIGYIGLQSNSGPVEFRNIYIRPIELAPLLASNDLSNFTTERQEQSRFAVANKELHVTNGPGQIESLLEFANFVLQLDCKVNGDGLNSGVFFRTLREGRWTGYESQIHNGFNDGDSTKPKDFGTGGIYRRQPARRVMAEDGEWFAKTIVADGPHVAVWVNGYQVSDWTDERPPAESPREGRRLGPGAIAIQGHDPTTDLLFRDIRVIELPVSEGTGDRERGAGK